MISAPEETLRLMVNFQRTSTQQWVGKLEAARRSKEGFTFLSDQCMSFYAKDCGFMWKPEFRNRYLGKIDPPKFEVTINKAFELVMIYGPYLLWECPFRKIQPYDPIRIDPAVFGDLQDDPQQGMFYQQLMNAQSQREKISRLRADLMQRCLNYLSREQQEPLKSESELAVIEALVKGRGCLWTEQYSFPASGRQLVGSFFGSVDDLFIDPDCNDPALKSAQWIARRHVNTHVELERRFKLPGGTLKKYCQVESAGSLAAHQTAKERMHRRDGQTHDLIVWYEIFSKAGVGTRQCGYESRSVLHDSFEEVVGDYAYLCVSPEIPWFLNAPPHELEEADDDDVRIRFAWPNPTYLDNRWPVALLDFNRNPESCWPIPPLAAAMGELIALNILVAAFLENAYENRTQIVAYLESAAKEVERGLDNVNGTVRIKIKDSLNRSINDIVQYLNKPGMNRDIIEAIRYVSELFDKRTGLVEFMYAQSTTQDRTARSTAAKEEKAGIRPDKMSRDVAAWQSGVARNEMLLAALAISGKDLDGLLGPAGAYLWDEFIASQNPEEICREMTATCEASDIRKPNKEREAQNMQSLLGWLLPLLQQNAMIRGDQEGVDAVNSFVLSVGDSIDQDVSGWLMQPFAPPPDPQMQELQQAIQQLELSKGQAEVQDRQASAAKKQAEAENIAQQAAGGGMAQMELEHKQADIQLDLMKRLADMGMDSQKHQQKLRQDAISFLQKGMQMQQSRELRNMSREVSA